MILRNERTGEMFQAIWVTCPNFLREKFPVTQDTVICEFYWASPLPSYRFLTDVPSNMLMADHYDSELYTDITRKVRLTKTIRMTDGRVITPGVAGVFEVCHMGDADQGAIFFAPEVKDSAGIPVPHGCSFYELELLFQYEGE